MKWSIILLSILLLATNTYSDQSTWYNICPNKDVPYCKSVGKNAHNNFTNPPLLRGIKLGKIIGVCWRPKGSVIGVSEAIPSAHIPKEVRTSPRNGFYYIIDDGGGKPFLRQCREIDAR